ncbi:motility associated factor glycosyltransferase family protein [[Clostridium] polysaccharolyticum]|uniref:Uncharacterized conserved protein n=1 Tax=[Clostridium] polysaccharolyticum TaxID=29364 RepID=A0A1I0CUR7_9FIRM|nr:6-hydroxymethylpterin diphosphokinase MptE-like protein [[Clostridium] polysaccharolyticum]SET23353.1 Uncharacterized conserved protein [[Clostridium] polysaccharolyticum]
MYSKNLNIIEKYKPSLFQKLAELDIDKLEKKTEKIENMPARDGNLITVVTKDGKAIRLNSAFRPLEEAHKWVQQYKFNNMNNHVTMYGMGNGYFVRELLSNMQEQDYLLVYEPCTELFLNALHNFDLEDIFKDSRFIIGVEKINEFDFHKPLKAIYGMENLSNVKFVVHSGYDKLFQREFNEYFKKEIIQSAESARVEYNTLLKLAISTLKNQFINIPMLRDSISITQLKEIWNSEVPAIVVAAGPSLADSLEKLKWIKGKAVIVAVDRSLQYLLDHGIKPDFVTTLDPEKSLQQFSTEESVDIPMFCLTASQPLIMERQVGRKIICWSGYYLYKDYLEMLGDFPDVHLSGSVATFTVQILEYLGIKKICLVGQDLSFHGEVTHVGDVVSNPCGTAGKLVNGIGGTKVFSRYDWIEFIKWFEDFIEVHPEITIIDTKKEGALIKGSVLMDLEQAIGDTDHQVETLMEQFKEIPPAFTREYFQTIQDRLVSDKDRLVKMKKKAKEGVGYCADLIRLVKQGKVQSKSVDSKVGKVKEITNYLKALEFYKMLDDLVIATMEQSYVKVFSTKEDEKENLLNIFDSSRSFFEAVVEVVNLIEPVMAETIHKLEEQNS